MSFYVIKQVFNNFNMYVDKLGLRRFSMFSNFVPVNVVEELDEKYDCRPNLQDSPKLRCWSCLFQKSPSKYHKGVNDCDQSSVFIQAVDHACVNYILHLRYCHISESGTDSSDHRTRPGKLPAPSHVFKLKSNVIAQLVLDHYYHLVI